MSSIHYLTEHLCQLSRSVMTESIPERNDDDQI